MDNNSLSQEITQLHAELCSAMGDPNRILLLYALAQGPKNVSDLTTMLGISQPSTSRHLKVLRERGLVMADRDGVTVVYQLTDRRLIEALDLLRLVLRDRIKSRAKLLATDFLPE